MKETPLYFPNDNYQLFGILYEPEEAIKNLGFVFIHPFAEEKLWTQRVYANFARELAFKGFPVLRFDVMGHGDSGGDFENSTIETRISDIHCAVHILKTKVPQLEKIGLLGLRLGGTLAALVAESLEEVQKLILWEPIVDGENYMQELLRINITTQTAIYKRVIQDREQLIQKMKEGHLINIDGYEISYSLYQQTCDINLNRIKKTFTGDCLVIQISRNQKKIKTETELLAKSYRNSTLKITPEFPFWKEIKKFYSKAPTLFNDTLDWLQNGE